MHQRTASRWCASIAKTKHTSRRNPAIFFLPHCDTHASRHGTRSVHWTLRTHTDRPSDELRLLAQHSAAAKHHTTRGAPWCSHSHRRRLPQRLSRQASRLRSLNCLLHACHRCPVMGIQAPMLIRGLHASIHEVAPQASAEACEPTNQ